MKGRAAGSNFLSSLNYNRVLTIWSVFIVTIGVLNFCYFYILNQNISSNQEAVRVLNENPSLALLLRNYPNVALLFVAIGIMTFLISRSIIKHIQGEQTALIWQIEQIKNADYSKRRDLRKYDIMHNTMDALHSLSDTLDKKS